MVLARALRWSAPLLLIVGLGGVAACDDATDATSSGSSSSGSTCVPGQTIGCACAGAPDGIQSCKADGTDYDVCMCGGMTTSSSSGQGGMGGAGGAMSSSSSGDPCLGHVTYAGKSDGNGPVWGASFSANGETGLAAGREICLSEVPGSDHVCDYEEVLVAEKASELSTIVAGTTAWVQRTTVAMVNGAPSAPGPGGNCNFWTYQTNHIGDGEYLTFDVTGVPTYHLDNDTVYDQNDPAHAQADLPCGGAIRSILCCYKKCVSPP